MCFAPIQHHSPRLPLLDLLEERIRESTPNTIQRVKNISVSELGYLLSQISEKAIADDEERLSAGGDPT